MADVIKADTPEALRHAVVAWLDSEARAARKVSFRSDDHLEMLRAEGAGDAFQFAADHWREAAPGAEAASDGRFVGCLMPGAGDL